MFNNFGIQKNLIERIKSGTYTFMLIVLLFVITDSFATGNLDDITQMSPEVIQLSMRYPYESTISFMQAPQTKSAFKPGFVSGDNVSIKKKSKGKAFWYSFLLPGAGEYYVGRKTMAKGFFFTEIALWAAYISFESYHKWKRDDMYIYAATHADAQARGKPSQYFVDIGNYDNIYDYNDAKQRQREFYKVYPVNDDYFWAWESNEHRKQFERMRISGSRAHNRAEFMIGGIIANHMVSAINAVWQLHRRNKRLSKIEDARFHFQVTPDGFYTMSILKYF
jgi:hypothetical protein